jgi:hypothetical protein
MLSAAQASRQGTKTAPAHPPALSRHELAARQRWASSGDARNCADAHHTLIVKPDEKASEVTEAIEEKLQRFSVPKLMECVTRRDREGGEGLTMRLAGIPLESKFSLVGNAVVARDLFRYSAA